MAKTWYEKDAVAAPGIAKAGGTGPAADTYYYIIIPYVTKDVNISPDFVFYWYSPQYYGKRCAEQSISVNGSEEIQLSWTKVGGCDGYIVMRTTTSGNYNYSGRQRIWDAGDVATFTDNNQSGYNYKVNIPERAHGCVVLTSAYSIWQILDDLFDVQVEDSALMGFGDAEFADLTATNGASFWGLAFCQFFILHINSGGATYPGFYDNNLEQQLWFLWSKIFINNGGTLSLGSQFKNSTYHGNCHFVFNRSGFQNGIYGVPGATFNAYGVSFGQWTVGGASNYIDDYINADWNAGALLMSSMRSLGFSNGDANVDIDGCDYFESYYQLAIRSSAGSGSINVERFRAHEAGNYIFMRGPYTYTLKDFDYSDWRAHQTDTDAWFYDPSSNPFTGAIVCINPSWKDKSSAVPVIVITDNGNQHTGTLTVKFPLDLKVVDQDGDAIEGATVTLYDTDGNTLFTTTTDSDGKIATQDVTHAIYSCDVDNNLVTDSKYPHRLYITKGGYRDINYNLVIDHKTDMTIPLITEWAEGGEFAMEATSIVEFEYEDEYEMEVIPGG